MNRQEIEAKVKEFLIDDLEIDEEKIKPEARLKEDIGIDSLDFVDIVVIVEKKLGFKIKTEDMAKVKTFNDFCDYIEKKIAYNSAWPTPFNITNGRAKPMDSLGCNAHSSPCFECCLCGCFTA